MIYCDTSLLVSALAREEFSGDAQDWFRRQAGGALCLSGWTIAEFSSALSLKVRRGELTMEARAAALRHWRCAVVPNLATIPVPNDAWELAAQFCDRHELNLRASDALHIALVSLGGHSLATLDRAMADAALGLGVAVETVRVD